MKNELTSTFNQLLYYTDAVNKNNLIRLYLCIDKNWKKQDLLNLKNHELRYAIIRKSIDDIDLMNIVIQESIRIKAEKMWLELFLD